MPDIHISVQGVKKQLENIAVTKACGPDLIPARVLKESAAEFAPILAEIFQHFLTPANYHLPGKTLIFLVSSKKVKDPILKTTDLFP
jgi:hypothetical protein